MKIRNFTIFLSSQSNNYLNLQKRTFPVKSFAETSRDFNYRTFNNTKGSLFLSSGNNNYIGDAFFGFAVFCPKYWQKWETVALTHIDHWVSILRPLVF